MWSSKGTQARIAFVTSILLTLIISGVAYYNITTVFETHRQVAQSRTILNRLDIVLGDLVDAETSARGYALSGDLSYLQPYHEAMEDLPEDLDALSQWMEQPEQRKSIENLSVLIDHRMKIMEDLISVRKSGGLEGARRKILTGEGKRLTDQIRAVINNLNQTERERLVWRESDANRRTRSTIAVVTLGSVAALTSMGVIALLAGRQLSNRVRAEKELDRFFTLSLDMLCMAGTDGHFKSINPAFEKSLGWSQAELTSKPFIEFVHPDDREKTAQEARKLMDGRGDAIQFQNRYVCKDGTYKWLSWNATFSEKELVIYATARDITHRKAVDEAKNEVIGLVSHELRAPLSSMLSYLDLVQEEVKDTIPLEPQRMLKIVKRNGQRIAQLINDYLDLDKIESGKITMNVQAQDLTAILEEAVETNRPYAAQFKVDLAAPRCPLHTRVMADRSRLLQALTNLLTNAAKYSPSGENVTVCAEPNGAYVRVEVTDKGPGIPPEDQSRIFQKFFQSAPPEASRRAKGSGLGLALSKALVETMGGRMGFTSIAGRGTTFYLDVPSA